MAGSISWDVVRELAGFRADKGCAISVYLDLDPSTTPTPADVATRVNSLLDEAEKSEEATREDLSHDQRQALRDDLARVRTYFEEEFDREGARAAAVFCSGLDGVWRALDLADPVADAVKVRGDFYLAPLVPLVERAGALVAVVSRERGNVYRLRAGRLEEVVDQFDEQPSRHDQGGWSQARYQRHIDELGQKHLRAVAEQLELQLKRANGARVVVVTQEERRPEFEEALSNEVKEAVVGWTQAEAHATPAELLEVAQPVLEEAHAREETEAAERWREGASKNARAASGWAETLEAASDARVDLLLFQEGATRAAWQCPQCGRASAEGGACPLDGTQMEERDDALDLAVHQTLAHGGSVLALRHQRDLEPVDGIGALLRY